jgi:hypothetical protein
MRFVIAAAIVFAASFLPLYIVGMLDPTSNPIGLGLLPGRRWPAFWLWSGWS